MRHRLVKMQCTEAIVMKTQKLKATFSFRPWKDSNQKFSEGTVSPLAGRYVYQTEMITSGLDYRKDKDGNEADKLRI